MLCFSALEMSLVGSLIDFGDFKHWSVRADKGRYVCGGEHSLERFLMPILHSNGPNKSDETIRIDAISTLHLDLKKFATEATKIPMMTT